MLEKEILTFIYQTNPYNYADVAAFINRKHPPLEIETVKSALKVLVSKQIVESQDGIYWPTDRLMICLTDQGRRDVEGRRQHEDVISVGRKANLLAMIAGAFILLSTIISTCEYFKQPESILPPLQRIDTALQNQNKELDSLKQAIQNIDSSLKNTLQHSSAK